MFDHRISSSDTVRSVQTQIEVQVQVQVQVKVEEALCASLLHPPLSIIVLSLEMTFARWTKRSVLLRRLIFVHLLCISVSVYARCSVSGSFPEIFSSFAHAFIYSKVLSYRVTLLERDIGILTHQKNPSPSLCHLCYRRWQRIGASCHLPYWNTFCFVKWVSG